MKRILVILGCCLFVFSGCKSPEERAMDKLDRAMKQQTYMMKRMQKTMDRTVKEMEEAEK
jgi:hypothetical protein